MENAVEALKIAFGVMLFVLALTLSISSFSQANSAVTAIVGMNDRGTEYTYIEPSTNRTRTVGTETIVPTMYRAYYENIEVRFLDNNGDDIVLYNKVNENGTTTKINRIDTKINSDTQLLDSLLKGEINTDKYTLTETVSAGGLYNYLSKNKFIENLGEYYQDGKKKTRVITYTLID